MNITKVIENNETTIQRQIVEYLELKGMIVIRLPAGISSYKIKSCPVGTPDLLVLGYKQAGFIEVKTPKGKLSKVQEEMHEKLRLRGFKVIIARSLEDVRVI